MSAGPKPPRNSRRFAVIAASVVTLLYASNAYAANQINGIEHRDGKSATKVTIRGTSTPTFTVYKLEKPTRVVIDVANAALGAKIDADDDKATFNVNSWAVGSVEAHAMTGTERSVVRVIVTLARPGTYKVKADGNDVVVSVTPRDEKPEQANSKDAERAREEAEKAKREAKSAKDEAKSAKDEAKSAKDEAKSAKADAESAKADAESAKDEAKSAKADAQAAKKRADDEKRRADAQAEQHATAMRDARDQAARAKREADAHAKSVKEAQAEVERARSAEKQARSAAKAAKRQAAKEAKRFKEQAQKIEKESLEARAAAEKNVAVARREADEARAEAAARAAEAKKAKADADAIKQEADERLAKAEKVRRDAVKAQKDAKKATETAEKRQKDAHDAERRATERTDQAERAEIAAERYRKEAVAAAGGDKSKADDLTKRAERAAKSAEKRRKQAEDATRDAESKRRDAEAAAQAADTRRAKADDARAEAERQRAAAEADRMVAENKRKEADAARAEAELRRESAESAAQKASAHASKAKQLRAEEEAAYQRAANARAEAEDQRVATEKATAELLASKKAASEAAAEAAQRREDVARADQAVAAAERKKKSSKAVNKAKAEAERLDALRVAAEKELSKRSKEVDARKNDVATLQAQLDETSAQLDGLKRQATEARTSRQQEEKLLADVTSRRAQEERELQRAREARAEALADAKRATDQAADAKRVAADAAADAARAREQVSAAEAQQQAAKESNKNKTATATSSKKAKKKTDKTKTAAKKKTNKTKTASDKPAADEQVAKARVRDVGFEDLDDQARVVIALSAPSAPEIITSDGKTVVIEIANVDIDADLERTLDTSKYRGPINAISAYRDPHDSSKVRVVVELDAPTKSALQRVGTTYYWDFDKPVRTADAGKTKKTKKKTKAKSKKSTKEPDATADSNTTTVVGGYGGTSTPITQKSVAQATGNNRKVYRGTKIDLDFKDADIHNLLRLLADVGGVNVVIPDEIKARVTVRLRRVPWDQALEVILASKGLWYRRDGNLYRVAPRKQLDAEDQAEAERINALVQSEAPEPEIFTLNYAVAKDMKAQLAPLLSPKGRIEVDDRTNALIINDIKSHRRRVIDLVRRLDTQTPQIQIEARIVEARSTFVREFGIQWGGNASASAAGGNATGLIFPNSASFAGGAEDNRTNSNGVSAVPSDFAVNLPAAVGTGSGGALGMSLGSVGGNFNLNLRLSALEDSGSVRIISAPKITVVNNVQAEISQGVSIPISVISANGVQTQFVPADLALKVTPHVAERDCSIAMELEVKKNEADFVNTGARGDPTILRKEAKTTILVADGETTVIGGIYTRNTGLSYTKVPFFGDLPVIGWFFKSRRENDERTEVLVFITPKITNKAYLRCE